MKDYLGIGFSEAGEVVPELIEKELALVDSELKQSYPALENFILNLASTAYAKGFEKAKLEDKQQIERINL